MKTVTLFYVFEKLEKRWNVLCGDKPVKRATLNKGERLQISCWKPYMLAVSRASFVKSWWEITV